MQNGEKMEHGENVKRQGRGLESRMNVCPPLWRADDAINKKEASAETSP
jgi:hypothetical protein